MCLKNIIVPEQCELLEDPLECEILNSDITDTCDYLDMESTCNLKVSDTDLTILHINIRGLISKQQTLSRLLYDCLGESKIDVITIVEMWLTKESLKLVNVPGYTYLGVHRLQKKGGGVGILVSDTLHYRVLPNLSLVDNHVEYFSVEIKVANKKIIITSLYRPPNTDSEQFLTSFNYLSKELSKTKCDSIIGTDHNLNLLRYSEHKCTRKFLECIIDTDRYPCITHPTRITHQSATLIDNIIVNRNLYSTSHSGIIVSDISDHLPCLTILHNLKPTNQTRKVITKRNFSEKKTGANRQ